MRWIGAAIIGVWSMLGSAAADDHYIKIECQPIGFGHSKLFGSATFTFDIQKKTAHGPMQFFQPMLPATFSDGRIEWVQKIYPASKDHFKYIVDTGAVDVVDATEAFGELQWGEFTWGGKPTDAVLATFRPIAFFYSATPVLARYVKIIISDASNSDNYVQVGRAYVAAAFTPTNNVAYGLETSFVDNSRSVISRGGQVYVDTVPKRRRFGFRFHYMDEDEAFSEANEIQRLKGLSGDVLMAIDVDDTTHRMRQSCYGRLATLQPLTAETTGQFSMDMAIEELI